MTKISIFLTDLKALFKPPISLLGSWAKRNSTLTDSLGGNIYTCVCVYIYTYKLEIYIFIAPTQESNMNILCRPQRDSAGLGTAAMSCCHKHPEK